ncbi:MAG: DUF3429 domain-containing protein [Rhizobiaceae bacterium]|nr:DUF3429 domain-containing protein [Rhizobiaceae bacterium]
MTSLLENNQEKTKQLAWFLSLGGFIPFGAIAVVLLVLGKSSPVFAPILDIFKVWSVIILSFLGGIRWGFAIANRPFDTNSLWLSVVGSILGWFALLLPDLYALIALLVLFCAHGAWDSFFINTGKAPPWFGSIRIVLTFLVATAHMAVIVAVGAIG